MIITKKHSIALLAIVSSMVFAGCQSDGGSDSNPSSTVSDWIKGTVPNGTYLNQIHEKRSKKRGKSVSRNVTGF